MFSDLIELLGLACLVAGVFVLLGLGAAFLAAGACLLFIGQGVNDASAARALTRARTALGRSLSAPVRRVRTWRARPKVA